MSNLTVVLGAAGAFLAIYWMLSAAVRVRAPRVIRCPETRTLVVVELDGSGEVQECSHWPAKRGCDQACVRDHAAR